MKVLVVNFYYPPVVDAHAYRWAQIAAHWAGQGHDVHVITGKVRGAPRDAIENGVRVTRVGLVSKPAKPDSAGSGPAARSGLLRRVLDVLRPLYRKLYWPDASWHWFLPLVGELLRRRREHYDLVVSYYPCMAGHMAVAVLKTWSRGSRFAWAVDYGDPFSTSDTMQPNNFAFYAPLNRALERTILRRSSAFVLTNSATAEAYQAVLGPSDKISVIPHLVDVDRFYAGASTPAGSPPDTINLCFVGGFHRNIREPDRLIELVRTLQHTAGRPVTLDIYGPLNGYQLSELAPPDLPQIRHHGPVSREHAIALLKAADVIVNVDNENCDMTPSKIVECISTGRPLLNVTSPQVHYEPLQHYERAGYAWSVVERMLTPDGLSGVRRFLDRSAKAAVAPPDIVNDAVGSHNLPDIARQYEKIASVEWTGDSRADVPDL